MQIFAKEKNRLVHSSEAEKRKDYICPECANLVRLRAGTHRLPHFFHLKKSLCRQAQKGLIHLQLQHYIHSLFEAEAEIEKIFPPIRRIADVACPQSKRIYEIQYSPISLTEARERCNDYEKMGFQVIWILHDETFNQKKISPAEHFLRTKTCYYSNMDEEGNGIIYDQIIPYGKRLVNLKSGRSLPNHKWPTPLFFRSKNWGLYHEGDFFDLALQNKFPSMKKRNTVFQRCKQNYLTLLHRLLKKNCEQKKIFYP